MCHNVEEACPVHRVGRRLELGEVEAKKKRYTYIHYFLRVRGGTGEVNSYY